MKNPMGYLLLLGTALIGLTVIGGISLWFQTVADTWTVEQTDVLAKDFSQVLWYGGIVFVSVVGYFLFALAPKPITRSRPAQPQYTIADTSAGVPSFDEPVMAQKALPPPAEDWYELEPSGKEVAYQ